jgi:hypothetical protein
MDSTGRKVGITLSTSRRGYTDYPTWLRAEPAHSFITQLLLSKNALCGEYLDQGIVQRVVVNFLETKDNKFLTPLGLLLTFEIYLRQLFEPTFLINTKLFVNDLVYQKP